MGLIYLLTTVCLLVLVSSEDLSFKACCPKGRILRVDFGGRHDVFGRYTPDSIAAKCVRSKATSSSLDGSSIEASTEEGFFVDRVLKKTGTMLPSCEMGLRKFSVTLRNKTESMGESNSNAPEISGRVRLGDYSCGQRSCPKGNVYVDDKPVCDDDWDDTDAGVVCRELGFYEGGYATKESYFGRVDLETQSGWDQVRCGGYESSLTECRHESHDDCGNSEGAGVVCYGDRDNYTDTSGGSHGPTNPYISGSGVVIDYSMSSDGKSYAAGEYCLAPSNDDEDEATVIACEPCTSEIICSGIRSLFDNFARFGGPGEGEVITRSDRSYNWERNHIILVADKNGDGKVTFAEFRSGIEDYGKKAFDVLDSDKDGFLDDEVSVQSINANLFMEALDQTYLFFDMNQDDILSAADAPEDSFRDWNEDGKISLREVFGVSLINLPAPIYRLYTKVDKDKNEKFSLEEATNFIKGTIYLIDQNEDCSINIDEILAMLNEARLPSKFQLAMRILGEHFLTLADFLLKRIVAVSDSDGDKKTSFDEILHLSDTSIIKEFGNVVPSLGLPSESILRFMECGGRRCGPRESEAQTEMWLNVLYDIVDNRKYDSVPENLCGM